MVNVILLCTFYQIVSRWISKRLSILYPCVSQLSSVQYVRAVLNVSSTQVVNWTHESLLQQKRWNSSNHGDQRRQNGLGYLFCHLSLPHSQLPSPNLNLEDIGYFDLSLSTCLSHSKVQNATHSWWSVNEAFTLLIQLSIHAVLALADMARGLPAITAVAVVNNVTNREVFILRTS